jgi:hypothetical protein
MCRAAGRATVEYPSTGAVPVLAVSLPLVFVLLAAAFPLAVGVGAYRQAARAKRDETAAAERHYRMLKNAPKPPRR